MFKRAENGKRASAFNLPSGGRRRIVFIDHTAALGGGEIALLNLVRHLDRSRHEPLVILFSDGPLVEKLRALGVAVHLFSLSPGVVAARKDSLGVATLLRVGDLLSALLRTYRLAGLIRALKADVVHANSLKADIIGGVAGRLAGAKVIWHVRDRIAEDYLPPRVASLFRGLCRIVPHVVVANSAATLRSLGVDSTSVDAIAPGASFSSRCQVVHDGTPPGAALDDRIDHGEGRGDLIRVGLVGRICRWKGQHVFLQAADKVRRQFPHARFLIVGAPLFGEEDYEGELRALATALDLDGIVEFTGFRENISELIGGLDLLVHASTIGEPFGQVVIEAMAAGKPVVATNGGGIPEVVVDGVTGLLAPMGDAPAMADAICRLIGDRDAAREMGRRGRQRVLEHFTIEKTAANVERIYARLLAPTSAGMKG